MAAGDGCALDGAADLAAAVTVMLHLYVCRHDDGIVEIAVDVRTAEIAAFAKNAEITAEIAEIAKIAAKIAAKISDRELGQVEQLSQFQPLVVLRHRLVGGAHAVVAVADKRVKVAVQQHRERNL